MISVRALVFAASALLAVPTASGHASPQTRAREEQRREAWQRVPDILRALHIEPGDTVADVGAGDGFFTSRLADAVGPSGRVLAVDVDERQLDRLRGRLEEEQRANVTVIKGGSDDPRLPDGSVDAALIVNAYHEMREHDAMLRAIRRALAPDGRLVLVEPISERRRGASRGEQVRQHEIAPEYVLPEVRKAGFRVIGLEDPFTTRNNDLEWMMTLVPERPLEAATTEPAARPQAQERDWRDPSLRIAVADLARLIASGGVTVIDVRDEGMFDKGHIPGAVLIPLEDVERDAKARLQALKGPVVTYCS